MPAPRIVVLTGRAPMLPAQVARELYAAPDPLEATRDLLRDSSLFDAALGLASRSLRDALEPWRNGGEAKKKRAPLKALTYALRMATRSTPFGLFAGTGKVERGRATTLSLSARPEAFTICDTRALHDRHTELERDPVARLDLPVVANDLLVTRGERVQIRHPERLRRGLDPADPAILHYAPASVRWSQTLQHVLDIAAEEQPLRELRVRVAAQLAIEAPVAAQLTDKLLDIGCLIFTRPAGNTTIGGNLSPLLDVAGAPPADAQVNTIQSFEGSLGEHVLNDVATLASLMLANAQPRGLADYRMKFLERYEGDSTRVPLLELVDPDAGIGAPQDPADRPERPEPVRDELCARLVARAMRDGVLEIELSKSDMRVLYPHADSRSENGVEVGFQIAARSAEAIDAGDYRIRPVYGLNTDGPHKTIHRFAQALGIDVRSLESADDCDGAGPLHAELVFTPFDTHYASLLQVPRDGYAIASRRERLPGTVMRIEPRDILIGLEGTRFVAYSGSLRRKLLVKESYMLQTTYFGPPHMRLLSMIGKQDHTLPRLFAWGAAGRLPFVPRLRFERLVLTPAAWSVPRAQLLEQKNRLGDFIDRWRRDWNVPRWVYLVERDLKLLLDLESPIAPALICDQLGSANDGYPVDAILRFEEMFPNFEDLWTQREGAEHFHEFVAGIAPNAPRKDAAAFLPAIKHATIKHLPGGEWTFAKLYCPASDIDMVIQSLPALVAAIPDGIVDRWFFLRYADPRTHVRLRLHANGSGHAVLAALISRLDALVGREIISHYAFDTYIPELDRYGGEEALEFAEQLFYYDSMSVAALLGRGALAWEERAGASLNMTAEFLQTWFGHFDRERWMERHRSLARAAQTIRWPRVRRVREALLGATASPGGTVQAVASLAFLERSGKLAVDPLDLCASLVHMHFNRIGVAMSSEDALLACLWHALHGLERQATGQTALKPLRSEASSRIRQGTSRNLERPLE